MRLRGEGSGVVANGTLTWKVGGTTNVTATRECAFAFVEGNTATPTADGILVTYNGTVCDTRVSGSVVIRKR